MELSAFGAKFTRDSGILSLMDDLGNALAGDAEMIMMGGGNPSHLPEVEQLFRARLQRIVDDPRQFRHLIGVYDPPQGEINFRQDLAALLRKTYGWQLSEENIALTNGSQSGFFMLFNMLAGPMNDGSIRKIQLPIAPEYIGYGDAGLAPEFFTAAKPQIEQFDNHLFKYHIDFDALTCCQEPVGALCISRPTNPTGNVISDNELAELDKLARQKKVPLIVDGAYGTPFPNLIFTQATPHWNENTILCLSLSKLGLPAARTGIVIGKPELIRALSGVNAILNLCTGSFGAALAHELVQSGEIISFSEQKVKPFYAERAQAAVALLNRHMPAHRPWHVHKPEGAMFLWLWLDQLPINSLELYQRLKARGVLVVSGHYFFSGIEDDWAHRNQCLRVTYTQEADKVERGIRIIAEEVERAYTEG